MRRPKEVIIFPLHCFPEVLEFVGAWVSPTHARINSNFARALQLDLTEADGKTTACETRR